MHSICITKCMYKNERIIFENSTIDTLTYMPYPWLISIIKLGGYSSHGVKIDQYSLTE